MQTEITRESLSVSRFLDGRVRTILSPAEPVFQRLFSFDRLWQLYETARLDQESTVERFLDLLGISYHVDAVELGGVPRSGPVLAVANHPFGLLEGALLCALLRKVRPDFRILANSLLAGVPELREKCIFVDPFGHRGSVPENAAALRKCYAWLRGGGMLVTFPAGEVAHAGWTARRTTDPPWNPALARMAQLAGAAAVPMFFRGSNSLTFRLAGVVHPGLRTAGLARQLLNKRGRCITVRIGHPVSSAMLQGFANGCEAIEYLRCRTYLLDSGSPEGGGIAGVVRWLPVRRPAQVTGPQPARELEAEIGRLPQERRLCGTGDLAVYVGTGDELPAVVREVGRLREIAFRGAGEGSGRSIDLDRFDRHYLHLVLWNVATAEIVGAYRLGATPDILPRFGAGGLYTNTLFRYSPEFFARLGPAIELGRSFIRPEYQRQYAPLLLLWKGIVRYAASRPECASLFGAVTISKAYHSISRQLIVKFLEFHRAGELAALVTPRTPYRADERAFRRVGALPRIPDSIDGLSDLLSDLESDGKGIPILVKQYLKAGGRVLGFNVDRKFSDALDALVVVDLRSAPCALLDRYLGKGAAKKFGAPALAT